MSEIEKIPVTIITGSLGSGKTTLLNWILQNQRGKKIAVVENDFGEVGVDDSLVCSRLFTEQQITGCVCCTIRADLAQAFKQLIENDVKPDCLIIETDGLADPIPICRTFLIDPTVQKYARLDAVITIVDARDISNLLDEVKFGDVENETMKQLAFADRIILNKIDLVDEAFANKLEKRFRQLNPYTKVIKANLISESVPIQEILGLDSFSIQRVLEIDSIFQDQDHNHDLSIGMRLRFPGDLSFIKLQSYLGRFVLQYGQQLYRYKGVVAVKGRRAKFIFQGIHMSVFRIWSEPWEEGELRENRFCFIGKNLPREEIEEQLLGLIVDETGTLRFKVGDEVQCNMEEGYVDGTVSAIWDEGNAYSVSLVNGMEVWAPEDVDEYIRKKHYPSG